MQHGLMPQEDGGVTLRPRLLEEERVSFKKLMKRTLQDDEEKEKNNKSPWKGEHCEVLLV